MQNYAVAKMPVRLLESIIEWKSASFLRLLNQVKTNVILDIFLLLAPFLKQKCCHIVGLSRVRRWGMSSEIETFLQAHDSEGILPARS